MTHAFPPSFTGVVAATLTPFTDDGALALDAVGPLVDFLVEGGAAAIMVGGTTGEFVALEPAERSALTAAFVQAADGAVPVVAHVGHVHLAEAQRLARQAADAGAAALTAIAPYYHRVSPAAVAASIRELARTVPELPFLVYNYPDAAGNPCSFSIVESLLDEPNLAGVKLSVGTLDEVLPYRAVMDRLCVLCGNDVLLPDVVAMGATAIVSGNAAAFPDVVSRLLAGLLAGDAETAAAAPGVLQALATLSRGGAPDRLRELLARRGLDTGRSRVRTYLPGDVDAAQDRRLFALLTEGSRPAAV